MPIVKPGGASGARRSGGRPQRQQVGCDFIPVGLALGEAEPETVEIGVPTVLFSRLLTGPIATILAYFAGYGLCTK